MVTIMQSLFTLSFYTPQLYNEPDKGRIVVNYSSDSTPQLYNEPDKGRIVISYGNDSAKFIYSEFLYPPTLQ